MYRVVCLVNGLLPGLGEVGPVRHHVLGEDLVLVGVAEGGVEGLPEDVVDLVAVHDAGPVGPGVHARPLVEVILVHEVLAHRVTASGEKVVRGFLVTRWQTINYR